MWCFLNFGFEHLGQTLPQVLQPSAPGMQAKATGQGSGSNRINEEASQSSVDPSNVSSSYPVFQVFSLFSCSLQGTGLKMDDCLRPSH